MNDNSKINEKIEIITKGESKIDIKLTDTADKKSITTDNAEYREIRIFKITLFKWTKGRTQSNTTERDRKTVNYSFQFIVKVCIIVILPMGIVYGLNASWNKKTIPEMSNDRVESNKANFSPISGRWSVSVALFWGANISPRDYNTGRMASPRSVDLVIDPSGEMNPNRFTFTVYKIGGEPVQRTITFNQRCQFNPSNNKYEIYLMPKGHYIQGDKISLDVDTTRFSIEEIPVPGGGNYFNKIVLDFAKVSNDN